MFHERWKRAEGEEEGALEASIFDAGRKGRMTGFYVVAECGCRDSKSDRWIVGGRGVGDGL